MYQVGVDIGGTNIAMGLVDEALDVVQRRSIPFDVEGGGERTAEIIHEGTLAMLKSQGAGLYDLDSVGVVVPGSIDPAGSVVINAYNLNFHNEPLKARIQKQFGDIPVFLANDADGAALAELHKGAWAAGPPCCLLWVLEWVAALYWAAGCFTAALATAVSWAMRCW